MNGTIRQLHSRKSTRAFEDRAISEDDKRQILEAAFQAPTAGCQQLYTILDITDPALREALAESCDHQPFIATAKLVLVFLADCQKWYDAFAEAGCEPRKPGAGDFLLAVDDALIAAQNAVVAAESLGIGSCYIGDIMERYEYHRDLFRLPEYVFPAAMLAFGYPTRQQTERKKYRRADMEYVVHENAYRRLQGDELRQLMETYKRQDDYRKWIDAFCKRKYNCDFSVEMSRSVAEFLKRFE